MEHTLANLDQDPARWQAAYAMALERGDGAGLRAASQALFQAYHALGNPALARKWTFEYIRRWQDRDGPAGDAWRPAPRGWQPACLAPA